MEFLSQPWPWYVAGPLIVLTMFLLQWLGKRFGISSVLETTCTIAGAGKVSDYFKTDWKKEYWNYLFILGGILGGVISHTFLNNGTGPAISAETKSDLMALGITQFDQLVPVELFSVEMLSTPVGLMLMIGGGFLVGFGTRYAGGCTSGHSISGIANLQRSSIIATIFFFVGGLVATHLLLPLILGGAS
ncbi:MAG: YeeE/YedE family protein [Fibrobacterales bacterium]